MRDAKRIISMILVIAVMCCIPIVPFGATNETVLDLGTNRQTTLRADPGTPSYPAYNGISRSYTWYIDYGDDVVWISASGQTCTVNAKKAGRARVYSKVWLSYYTYDSRLDTLLPRDEGRVGGTWDIVIYGNDVTVTFDANGGSVSQKSAEMREGQLYGTMPVPTRMGYDFQGWYLNDQKIVADSAVTQSTDHTLVASWAKHYDVIGIEIEKNVTVTKSYKYTLEVNVLPKNASNKNVTYKSSNTDIVTVDDDGVITGKEVGSAVITAITEDGGYKAVCNVTVIPTPVRVIDFTPYDGKKNVAVDISIKAELNMEAVKGHAFDEIKLMNQNGDEVECVKTISEDILTIKPMSVLEYFTEYTVIIPKGALNSDVGRLNEEEFTASFTTEKFITEAPEIRPKYEELTYYDAIWITCYDDGASIYYTTDGSDPKTNGILYTEDLYPVDESFVVRAIAVYDGIISEETTKRYKMASGLPSKNKLNFGGSKGDEFSEIISTGDGYVAIGHSYEDSFGNGDWESVEGKGGSDGVIVKFDSELNVIWKKNFGGESYDYFNGITALEDGFVAVGNSYKDSFETGDWEGVSSNGGKYSYTLDATIVKFDNDGNVIWKKNYGGSGDEAFSSVTAVADGVVTVGCWDYDYAIIVKYDNEGNVVWEQEFGIYDSDNCFEEVITAADDIVAVGYLSSDSLEDDEWEGFEAKGGTDAVIIKLDNDGNVIWKKNFGGSDSDCFTGVVEAEDGFVAVGYSYEDSFGNGDFVEGIEGKGDTDGIIVKYDNDGNMIWKKNFGGSGYDHFNAVTAINEGFVAVGSSDAASFETGDWEDVLCMGIEVATVVNFDNEGNVAGKGIFGGSDDDYFNSVAATEGGFVAAGCSAEDSFGTYSWEGVEGKGGDDATIVKFEDFSDEEVAVEKNTLTISGGNEAFSGGDFTESVSFIPQEDVAGANVQIRYPLYISYAGHTSKYENVYATEHSTGNYNYLTISVDFSYDNPMVKAGELCELAGITFSVAENATEKFSIEFTNETMLLNSEYSPVEIGEYETVEVSVTAPKLSEIFIIGRDEISEENLYRVATFPEVDVEVKWSVSDETVATIDQDGRLTPLKNGTVTITATADNQITKSKEIEILGIKSYINSLSTNAGRFAENYEAEDTERVLYVPKGTGEIRLTAKIAGGILRTDTGTMYNNVPKTFNVSEYPYTITLTLSAGDYDDCVYTITVKEDDSSTVMAKAVITGDVISFEITPCNITSGKVIVALYSEDNTLLQTVEKPTDGTSFSVEMPYIKKSHAKVFVWEEYRSIQPICGFVDVEF